MADISTTAKVALVELLVQGILYGLYLCNLGHCIRWLLFEDEGWKLRAAKDVNRVMLSITVYIFLASTVLFVDIAITSFSIPWRENPSLVWLDMLSNGLIWMSILLIADAVLIFRCWVIFNKSWLVICVPLSAWCACIICNTLYLYCSAISLSPPNVPRFCSSINFPVIFYSCNIIVNVYATLAIVCRLVRAAKTGFSTSRLLRIRHIIMDSGVLYTLSSTLLLASLINDSISAKAGQRYAIPLLSAVVYPLNVFVPAIAFNLILIRVGEQRARTGTIFVDSIGGGASLGRTVPSYPASRE